jgi:hypothetical protein
MAMERIGSGREGRQRGDIIVRLGSPIAGEVWNVLEINACKVTHFEEFHVRYPHYEETARIRANARTDSKRPQSATVFH